MGATELLLLTASILGAEDVTMLQFSADWCKHCQAVAPTVDQLERDGYPIVRINADTHKELLTKHRVRALPTFVLMKSGRELNRAEGELTTGQLTQMFQRAGFKKRAADGPTFRAQSPTPGDEAKPQRKGILSRALEQFTQAESQSGAAPPPAPPSRTADPMATVGEPPQPRLPSKTPSAPTFPTASYASETRSSGMKPEELAMKASVKLRIEDAEGFSFGSGTIIDTHGDDALILTCGHIFRDSDGKGGIEVEITTDSGVKKISGHLLAWEPDYHDIGLVAVRPGAKVVAAKVAPRVTFRPHDSVFSIGCDRGADPSLRRGRIAALNRFQGAPNIEVTGKPVLGRSGGGLFDRDGQLIGVCKLANPTDDEGIYASIESIHHHLNKTGLKHVYQSQPTQQLVANNGPAPAKEKSPEVKPTTTKPGLPVTPVSNIRQIADAVASSDADSEVIVIVRSKTDPQAKSRVMVVEDANDELLDAIHAAVNRHRNPASVAETFRTNDRRQRR